MKSLLKNDQWNPVPTEYKKETGQPQVTVRAGSGCSVAFNKAATQKFLLGRFRWVQVLGKSELEFRFLFHNDDERPASFVLRPEGTKRTGKERGRVFYARPIAECIDWFRIFQEKLPFSTQFEMKKVGPDLFEVDFRKPISVRKGPRTSVIAKPFPIAPQNVPTKPLTPEDLKGVTKEQLEAFLRFKHHI